MLLTVIKGLNKKKEKILLYHFVNRVSFEISLNSKTPCKINISQGVILVFIQLNVYLKLFEVSVVKTLECFSVSCFVTSLV